MFFPPSSIIRSVGRAGAECAGSVDVIAAHSKMAPKVTLFIQIVRSRPQPAWACREHRLTLRALKVADSGFFFLFFFWQLSQAHFHREHNSNESFFV